MQFINDIIEFSIEFAWQMVDEDDSIPRAESRWLVLNKVLAFLAENDSLPKEDIDEFVEAYLAKTSDSVKK